MKRQPEDAPQFDTATESPYPAPLDETKDGRWFEAHLDNELVGVVWTDDDAGFGFLGRDAGEVESVVPASENWSRARTQFGLQKLSATEAFDEAAKLEGNPEVSTGKLSGATDIIFAPNSGDKPVVAAATEPAAPKDNPGTIMFTVSDDEDVLELILSNDEGIFVRENGKWNLLSNDDDAPTVWDQEWLDVSEEAVPFWDNAQNDDEPIKRDTVVKYTTTS